MYRAARLYAACWLVVVWSQDVKELLVIFRSIHALNERVTVTVHVCMSLFHGPAKRFPNVTPGKCVHSNEVTRPMRQRESVRKITQIKLNSQTPDLRVQSLIRSQQGLGEVGVRL